MLGRRWILIPQILAVVFVGASPARANRAGLIPLEVVSLPVWQKAGKSVSLEQQFYSSRDQRALPQCYAHATIAVLEAALYRNFGIRSRLNYDAVMAQILLNKWQDDAWKFADFDRGKVDENGLATWLLEDQDQYKTGGVDQDFFHKLKRYAGQMPVCSPQDLACFQTGGRGSLDRLRNVMVTAFLKDRRSHIALTTEGFNPLQYFAPSLTKTGAAELESFRTGLQKILNSSQRIDLSRPMSEISMHQLLRFNRDGATYSDALRFLSRLPGNEPIPEKIPLGSNPKPNQCSSVEGDLAAIDHLLSLKIPGLLQISLGENKEFGRHQIILQGRTDNSVILRNSWARSGPYKMQGQPDLGSESKINMSFNDLCAIVRMDLLMGPVDFARILQSGKPLF